MSKRIVIISALYPPEPVVSARMSHDLAVYLSDKGAQVTVLCPHPSRPSGTDYNNHKKASAGLVPQESGIEIVRLPSFTAPQSRIFDRAWESFSFGRHVCKYLTGIRNKPDALYVNAWPLLSQALIANYVRCNDVPMILQVMDTYPESLNAKLSAPLSNFTESPLFLLDSWIAQQSTSVVVISENMRRSFVVKRRISQEKVVMINSWQDEALFENLPSRQSGCRHYGVPEAMFTFLFLGNIGPVAGVDFLIRAFHKAAIDDAQLLIIGDGSAKGKCVDLVKKLCADNIRFISDHSVKNVPLLQSMAHVCLLPLKLGSAMSSVPSKLSAYMLSAKPVLATVDDDSDTARTIREAGCGWVGDPENVHWLSAKMRDVASLPAIGIEQYGLRGRYYGLAHFSKTVGVRRLAKVILAAAVNDAFESNEFLIKNCKETAVRYEQPLD